MYCIFDKYIVLSISVLCLTCMGHGTKGMMIPSEVYEDFMVFWPYMFRTDGLIHCSRCGLLYGGNVQYDCIWHYEWYEVGS